MRDVMIMKFQFEDYIAGDLPEDKRRLLEQQLANTTALKAQLQEEEEFMARLKRQMLREKVETAMKPAAKKPRRPGLSPSWLWAIAVLLLAVFLVWRLWGSFGHDRASEVPPAEQPAATPEPEKGDSPAAPVPSTAQPAGRQEPIARQVPPARTGEGPLSGLRGAGDASAGNTAREAIHNLGLPGGVSALPALLQPAGRQIGQGRYQEAGRLLEVAEQQGAAGDTLAFLRGLCLLKQEKGLEAARYFIRLDEPGRAFDAESQWCLALSWLAAGQEGWAVEQLGAIMHLQEHPHRAEAAELLEKLNGE